MKIKIILVILAIFLFIPTVTEAKLSTSYKQFKYSPPRKYQKGGQLKLQNGYLKNNGKYIQPHLKTYPDQYKWNNRKNLYGW